MDVIIAQPSPEKIQVLPHRQYQTSDSLTPSTVSPSPIDQFRIWFKQVVEDGIVKEPEAISLSTATPSGIPSARMVLFKELDERGFELIQNPYAAIVFYWREIHKSVRVMGKVEKISREESEAYFRSRPVGSQLGAWASKQSSVVAEGEVQDRLKKLEERFASSNGSGVDIPMPDFWGGWRVIPRSVSKFWCGKPSRLHDRVRYLREEGSPMENPSWKVELLAP
ncbi:pyridoxamine 5'-phosphate oxidase [Gymnopus androsaceus JB14]|uniref:pyridoxal 5'-phosphate synthase n=1 Tax=Gymnopus androsaceus JB14 TaxID=1447944 RepID=A0A6A4GRD3_9AGAR|nr:pyridoxamine 5'-phosphate oxidase [Gymnopus androsaceus JB14]